jgi:solute carrier family 25 phosphate transporter 23/24/25/41
LEYTGKDDMGIVTKLALGAISGTFAQTLTYPLDVVRRRMQMLGYGGQAVEYTSISEAFKRVYTKYGLIGFYKGLIPNYLKVVPVVSINFVVYEYMKRFLGLSSGGGKEV